VNDEFVNYMRMFYTSRYYIYSENIKAGVPQGDSCSSLCFCLAIIYTMGELKKHGYELAVFCDDIAIIHKREISKDVVINHAI